MKKTVLGIMTLAFAASLFGCNTIRGVGDDLQAVGGWVTKGSTHVEESIGNNPPGSKMEK